MPFSHKTLIAIDTVICERSHRVSIYKLASGPPVRRFSLESRSKRRPVVARGVNTRVSHPHLVASVIVVVEREASHGRVISASHFVYVTELFRTTVGAVVR